MIIRNRKQQQRGGHSAVEMALVIIPTFLLFFGIFEYSVLLFTMNLTANAARDTARFAAVKTGGGTMPGDQATFAQADLVSLMKYGTINGTTYGMGMCGMQGNISGMLVSVFTVDPVALAQSPCVVQSLSGSSWNSASFSQYIAVQTTGSYTPMLPTLLMLNSSFTFNVTVMESSEAN